VASFVTDSIITTKKLDVNSIDLDTVEKDGNLYQVMKVLRVNRLRTAILSDSIDQIGKFKTVERFHKFSTLIMNLSIRKFVYFRMLIFINIHQIIDEHKT